MERGNVAEGIAAGVSEEEEEEEVDNDEARDDSVSWKYFCSACSCCERKAFFGLLEREAAAAVEAEEVEVDADLHSKPEGRRSDMYEGHGARKERTDRGT